MEEERNYDMFGEDEGEDCDERSIAYSYCDDMPTRQV